MNSNSPIVCHCLKINQQQVVDFLQSHPSATLNQVKEELGAGSRCGACQKPAPHIHRKYYLSQIMEQFQQDLRSSLDAAILSSPKEKAGRIESKSYFSQLPMVKKITMLEQVLDQKIRPVLQKDQGNVVLMDVSDLEVTVDFEGVCSDCPSSRGATLDFIVSGLRKELKEDGLSVSVQAFT